MDGVQVREDAAEHLDRISQPELPLDGTYRYSANGVDTIGIVLDGGVRATHEQFYVEGDDIYRAMPGAPGGDTSGPNPNHGTAVASFMSGKDLGPAFEAGVISYQAVPESDFIASCEMALETWIEGGSPTGIVVNASVGFPSEEVEVGEAAQSLIDGGALFVAAAGNTYQDGPTTWPQMNENVLNVGLLDNQDQIRVPPDPDDPSGEAGTTHGSGVAVYAPSDTVLAASSESDTDYEVTGGSSLAAPLAAGVALLIWEQHPEYTNEQVKQELIDRSSEGQISNLPEGSNNRVLFTGVEQPEPEIPWIEIEDLDGPDHVIQNLEPGVYEVQARARLTELNFTTEWSDSNFIEVEEEEEPGPVLEFNADGQVVRIDARGAFSPQIPLVGKVEGFYEVAASGLYELIAGFGNRGFATQAVPSGLVVPRFGFASSGDVTVVLASGTFISEIEMVFAFGQSGSVTSVFSDGSFRARLGFFETAALRLTAEGLWLPRFGFSVSGIPTVLRSGGRFIVDLEGVRLVRFVVDGPEDQFIISPIESWAPVTSGEGQDFRAVDVATGQVAGAASLSGAEKISQVSVDATEVIPSVIVGDVQ